MERVVYQMLSTLTVTLHKSALSTLWVPHGQSPLAGIVLLWKYPWDVVADHDKSLEQQLSTVNLSQNPQNPGMLPGTFSSSSTASSQYLVTDLLAVLRQITFLSLFQAEIRH